LAASLNRQRKAERRPRGQSDRPLERYLCNPRDHRRLLRWYRFVQAVEGLAGIACPIPQPRFDVLYSVGITRTIETLIYPD
jgi:hypothetical protein